MKYGGTLRQRSIPEWGHYNVDYDDIKHLIKEHTTPGKGKAVSIPGQGDTAEKAFEDELYFVLVKQHERINLFIKSKSGEIERRLDHLSKQIVLLQTCDPPSSRLPAKRLERYAKIDADVTKAGEEIRSLSRFRGAQRTAFTKLLKKYKKWTNKSELGNRFKLEVTDQPDSFCQLDLGYLLDQYIDVLQAVRAPFQAVGYPTTSDILSNTAKAAPTPSTSQQLFAAIEDSSEVDYDTALATIPLGSRGSKASYWVHPDYIVELQVFLLQHMRLYKSNRAKTTPHASPLATPIRRNSSAKFDSYGNFGKEDDTGLFILDKAEQFAEKQNTTTVGECEERGRCLMKAAGNARWTSSGEAAVAVRLESVSDTQDSETLRIAKLKRKYLDAFLNTSEHFNARRSSRASSLSEMNTQTEDSASEALKDVRDWLVAHEQVKPIVGVYAKRSRFVGLNNSTSGGVYATLDIDICMKKSLHGELMDNDWVTKARTDSSSFPHAVLEIRREGSQSTELIDALDRSHLTERVRGFSLETHAVWMCCKPAAMSAPLWIPTLSTDIRKLPEPVKRQRKHAGSNAFSSSPTLHHTSTSTNSTADGQTSPYTPQNADSSATSGPEHLPTLSAFKKKPKRDYGNLNLLPSKKTEQTNRQQGYWNEYDHPEDGSDDEAYYIYVDPNATTTFPGQEALVKLVRKTKQLFRFGKLPEEATLLSSDSPTAVSPISDGEESESSSDEAARAVRFGGYGTLVSPYPPPETHREGYFRSIFHFLRNPHRDVKALRAAHRRSEHQMDTLMNVIERRQHDREMTKFRLYATCLAASVVIDIILGTLTATSRRKERGMVDAAILFGTISNLLLLIVAVGSMRTRNEKLGWFHQTVVFVIVVAVIIVDVFLLRWVLN
ncbi:hypothetical protein K432DRAFT_407171 [Lepidopterella palustris CBS 459.81]|uniref:SPX domain-containing protein n=1 Tax=Lepidopterella palustris CBS 459.81 TaxID=1314670 RepID=A0A8E2E5K6_9PEZI|nr:hypothetical protein K432DRAFT_407171 [Lepidopterella palustris CBS 459.81]